MWTVIGKNLRIPMSPSDMPQRKRRTNPAYTPPGAGQRRGGKKPLKKQRSKWQRRDFLDCFDYQDGGEEEQGDYLEKNWAGEW